MSRSIQAVVSLGFTVGLAACGGGGASESPPEEEAPGVVAAAVVPACTGTSAWGTMGHDARRSSTSDGCAWHPLRKLWEYEPVAGSGRSVQGVERALAETGGVYVTWNSNPTHAGSAGSPAIDKVDVETGARVWSVDRLLNDNHYGGTRELPLHQWDTEKDRLGSIATDNGFIYLAAIYNFQCSTNCDPNQPRPFASGLYGWDLATGARRWSPVPLEPASHISAAGNRIYLLERDLTTGAVTFNIRNAGYNGASLYRSAPFPSSQVTGYQAPVLVGGRAIVAAQESSGANLGTVLYSFDALSGGTPLTMALPGVFDVIVPYYGRDLLDFSTTPYAGKRSTSIAAASGTKDASGNSVPTLVIASRTGLHVVAVSTLTTLWSATKQALVGTSEGGALRDPIIVKDRVYVADRNKLYALGL